MRRVEIKHRITGAVLYATDVDDDDPRPTRTALERANLAVAYLAVAYLRVAYLRVAYLRVAYLRGANLAGANLAAIHDDFRTRLDCVPNEVAGLLAKIEAGEVDGSAYQGECCCFVGTVAKLRGCRWDRIKGLLPDASSLTEKWFTGITTGHTPASCPVAAITSDWIREWQAERGEGELVQS